MDNNIRAAPSRRNLFMRAVEIIRSAPSSREAAREIVQRALNRLPATKKAMRDAKTTYWQNTAKFESFIRDNDAATVPGAAYMNAVINEFFAANCPTGCRVLDVGCGHGVVSVFLAKRGCSVIACDVSEPMVRELMRQSAGLNIDAYRADAYHLPFDDNKFDRVVARMFLYQFPDWPRILQEMARCCRPGGRLLLHVTSSENAKIARRSCPHFVSAMGDLPRRTTMGNRLYGYGKFDSGRIRKAAKRCGLKLVERAPCMFFHNNPLISFSLGRPGMENYQNELSDRLRKPEVLEFVQWFERAAVQQMPFWISFYNLLVLEKL
jgi:ubiquinone/menaquinone biosynthesis C-methylase UbiE